MSSAAGIIGNLRILVDADTSRAQSALRKMGGQAGVAGAAIGAGLGVAGIAALRIGDDYKAAMDSIRVGTGATGDALSDLEGSFKSVAGHVREDIGMTAQVLANLNTGLKLTGAPLEALTEKAIKFGRITKFDVAAGTSSIIRLFGDWSVATDDQSEALDKVFRASQSTGIEVDNLMRMMVEYGAPLRQLNYTFDESAAMLGKWEREGVNIEKVTAGMRIGIGRLMKDGYAGAELAAEWEKRLAAIADGTADAGSALSLFGSRNAADMIAALQEGRFEIDEYVDAIANGTDTVDKAIADTRTFADTVGEMANRIKVAVGPVTDAFAGIAESMGTAIYLLPAMAGALGNAVGRMWAKVMATGAGQKVAAAAGALAGKVYAAAAAVAKKLMAGVVALWNMMGGKRVMAVAAAAGTKAGAAYATAAGVAGKAGAAISGAAAGGAFGTAFAAAAVATAGVLSIVAVVKVVELHGDVRELQANLSEAVESALEQSSEDALKHLAGSVDLMSSQQGLDRMLADTLAGGHQAEGLRNLAKAIEADATLTAEQIEQAGELLARAAHEVTARGNKEIAAEIDAIAATISQRTPHIEAAVAGAYDPLSSIAVPAIAGPIRQEFKLASAEVARGFGNVKAALANPPQMISKKDRLGNMAGRMKKIMANVKKATEVGDPWAQRYWEKARARQQQQIDKLKGTNVAKLGDIKGAYEKAGVAAEGTWADVRDKTKQATTDAADAAIAQTERIPTALEGMDLTAAGTNLMATWAAGIRAGISSVIAAADEAAAAVAARTDGKSPPPKGPLAHIDKGGRRVMDAWLSGFDPKRAGQVGARVAGALGLDGAMLAAGTMGSMAAAGMAGGGVTHVHIGTLIADESGLDELERRMNRRQRRTSRSRRLLNDVN